MSVRLLRIVESLVTYKGYDYLLLDGSTSMQVGGACTLILKCCGVVCVFFPFKRVWLLLSQY